MTTRTSAGTASRNFSSSTRRTAVPVGLFGLHTKTSLVRSLIASAMAFKSWRSSAVSGTFTDVAAEICTIIGYASKDRQA